MIAHYRSFQARNIFETVRAGVWPSPPDRELFKSPRTAATAATNAHSKAAQRAACATLAKDEPRVLANRSADPRGSAESASAAAETLPEPSAQPGVMARKRRKFKMPVAPHQPVPSNVPRLPGTPGERTSQSMNKPTTERIDKINERTHEITILRFFWNQQRRVCAESFTSRCRPAKNANPRRCDPCACPSKTLRDVQRNPPLHTTKARLPAAPWAQICVVTDHM